MATDALTPADLFKQAMAAYQAGQLVEVERLCAAIFAADSEHFDATRLTAVVHYRRGRPAETLASYDRMLAIRPDYAEGHNNRGVVLQHLRRLDDALASYDKAIAINPDYAEAHNNRGVALQDAGRLDEALASYDAALTLRPDYAEAHYNRAVALVDLERFTDALASFDNALAVKPDNAIALNKRAAALCELGRFEEALAGCDQALAIHPQFAEAHNNRGLVLTELRRFPEALAAFAKAQELSPDNAVAHCNEAATRLLSGDFVRGWAKLEWRLKRGPAASPQRRFAQPQWDGLVSLYDKTILLHGEGRLSDTIQFCRYVALVAGRGARVILEVAEPLHRLATGLVGAQQVVCEGETLPTFDLHCPLMSLPLAFGTRLDSIPSGTPYLRPASEALMTWEMRLSAARRPRIGIAWAGNPRHGGDRNRSIALATLLPLLRLDATFVRLQKDLRAGDEAVLANRDNIFDPTDMIEDFADTAALLARLDLVVSVDTGVAHLAGALAKPVFVLLPFTPDWRWLLGRNTTSWYPTARLYRQATPGDWGEVVARVAAELPGMPGREQAAASPVRNLP